MGRNFKLNLDINSEECTTADAVADADADADADAVADADADAAVHFLPLPTVRKFFGWKERRLRQSRAKSRIGRLRLWDFKAYLIKRAVPRLTDKTSMRQVQVQ